jgi:hypothetical protein
MTKPSDRFRTYDVENGVVIAGDVGWLPGVYDTAETAIEAFTLMSEDDVLSNLSHIYRADGLNRPVTRADLRVTAPA